MLHAYMLGHCDGVWRTDHTMATYKLLKFYKVQLSILRRRKFYYIVETFGKPIEAVHVTQQ
jgi:hypothetical protein